MTLAEFLLTRIAEMPIDCGWNDCEDCRTNADTKCDSFAKRDWQSKRRIVEQARDAAAKCPEDDWPSSGGMELAPLADLARWQMRVLAQPYADHSDFRPEWAA